MSAADQSTPLSSLPRRVPYTVRFSAQFVNRMWDRLQKSAPIRAYVAGLLFGRSELDFSEVQVFRSFPNSEVNTQVPPDAVMVEALVEASRKDPEVATLHLLGWYAFRPTGGLHESDVAFHNSHFRLPNDIALIIRPEQQPNVLFEVYSKSGTALLSEEDHRWGSLRLATSVGVAGPIDVAMRAKIGDDFYLRAYEVSKTLDRAERREHWAIAVETTKRTMRALLGPRRKEPRSRDASMLKLDAPPPTSQVRLTSPEPPAASSTPTITRTATAEPANRSFASLPALQRVPAVEASPVAPSLTKLRQEHALAPIRETGALQTIRAGDPPALPAVVKAPKSGVPWLSSVAIAAVAAATTFSLFYYEQFSNGAPMPAFLRAIFPDTGLNLHVEGQGDRVLLSWNRHNTVVVSSLGGVLHIDDGTQHRDVRLDAAQIANGAVLYRPASDDVNFRLEIRGQQGRSIVDTMRVLDGGKTVPVEIKSAPPDLSSSGPAGSPTPGSRSTAIVSPADLRPLRITPGSTPARNGTIPDGTAASGTAASGTVASDAADNRGYVPSAVAPPVAAASAPNELSSPAGETAAATKSDAASTPASAPVAQQEARATPTTPVAANETPKSSASDAVHPADSPKQQNWEDSLAGRTADPTQPRPASSPAAPSLDASPVGNFVPPKPRKQVLPDLRSFGINSIAATSQIEVNVKVNKRGRVAEAKVVNHGSQIPPNLAHAAIDAARQWTFQPATLQGKSVPSDHTIVFEFRPANR